MAGGCGSGCNQSSANTHQVVEDLTVLSNHIISAEIMGSFKRRSEKFMEEYDKWNNPAMFIIIEAAMRRTDGLLQLPSFSYLLIGTIRSDFYN